MAPSKKMSRKDVKAPDEFLTSMGKVLDFLKMYGGWLSAAVLLILIAIVAGVMIVRHKDAALTEEALAFDKAAAQATVEVVRPAREGEAKPAAPDAKATEESRKKVDVALADIEKFASEHKGTPIGRLANLARAAAAFKAGRYDVAVDAYTAYLAEDGQASFAFVLWEAAGYAAEAAGKRDAAEKAFAEMTKSQSSLARAAGYMHLGDLVSPAMKVKADDPSDAARAKDAYEKGLKEVAGEESLMSQAQLSTRRSLQERLAALN